MLVLDQPVRPIWHKTGATTATPVVVLLPNRANVVKVYVDVASLVSFGSIGTALTTSATNAVQTIKSLGGATGGSITVTFANKATPGATPTGGTATITIGDNAATIDTALEALTTIGTGGITTGGGAFGTNDVTVTFDGARFTGTEVPLLEIRSQALTGGTNPVASVTTTTAGLLHYTYQEASTQEQYSWDNSLLTFLYIATVTGSGNYRVSAYL